MKSKILFIISIVWLCFILRQSNTIAQNKVSINKPYMPAHLKEMPEWANDAIIYKVNVRQFTKEGTFEAFTEHLPRLKELGIDVLWFMPIHPISKTKRKGTLGNCYAVSDYRAVNPEFGNITDFKKLVEQAHEMGFKVVLDWVANHTGWDHQWITQHPEWYTKGKDGAITSPKYLEENSSVNMSDWTDVADLNFDNPNLHLEILREMLFWILEMDIDGFHCDEADEIPLKFWDLARREIESVEPLFMLAEGAKSDYQKEAFDIQYAEEFHQIINQIAKGEKDVNSLDEYLDREQKAFPYNEMSLMRYTANLSNNHKENHEQFGDATKALTVLTYTLPGMPLIHCGQEMGFDKHLEAFEKDEIVWKDKKEMTNFYESLNRLKKHSSALQIGDGVGDFKKVLTSKSKYVYAFMRQSGENYVLTVVNLSNKEQRFTLETAEYPAGFRNGLTMDKRMADIGKMTLPAWGYSVLIK